ncbi:MAG: WD40/YVTN/BNR-like repeat-containing protein, partial [Longimicrobiales bacterium]
TNHMWATISGGDGFVTQQDPVEHHVVYAESQGGNMGRINLRSGERTSLRKPSWLDKWRMLEDSILIYRGEGAPPPEVEQRIAELRAQQTADSAAFALRWNWNTPFLLSPHDRRVFYAGANRVLKSTNRGEDLTPISPDLTYADTMKIRISTQETGGITTDATGAETYGTIVSLAESPRRAGWLFAGTDDGRVWLTRDDGANWTELTSRFRGVPANTYVSRIEPSWHDENVLYVTFDGHRTGDFTPYVFVTSDGGRSFRSIAGGLPSGGIDFVHVIREDPVSPNLLYVGTDVGLYVSLDRGATWRRFMHGMGTVPVHDLKIHPRDHELIAGTHGRSILVTDVAPLQQLAGPAAPSQITFFRPKPGLQFGDPHIGGESTGQRVFEGDNVDYGAELTYWIPPVAAAADTDTEGDGDGAPRGATSDAPASNGGGRPQRQERPQASIAILDAQGDTVQTMNGPATAGLHRVYWNYRTSQTERTLSPSEKADSAALIARATELADSLLAAGADSAAIARVRTAIATGDIGSLRRRGGGGGGGAGPGEQNLR